MNYRNTIFTLLGAAVITVAAMTSCDDMANYPLVKLGALESEYLVEAEASTFSIDFYVSGPYHLEFLNEADWLTLTASDPVDGMATLTAQCSFNEGFKRRANVVLCSDEDLARRDTLSIKQKSLVDAVLSLADASIIVPGAGGELSETITTNVPFEDMDVVITYNDEENADWITNLEIIDSDSNERVLRIDVTQNTDDDNPRVAIVDLSFTDGWDETAITEFNLLQRNAKEELGREITFEEFRNDYALGNVVEDYVLLSGIVVSDKTTLNAVENEQSTNSSIDYTVAPRTIILESDDGKYGVSILAATEDDNVFDQYDHAQILIHGTTATLKEEPDRYEITGFDKSMITSRISGAATDVPVKYRTIGTLTDDDIYTYVILQDVEFPIRKGELTPINEGYSLAAGANNMAKYPLLVRDKYGDSMYLMTNTSCVFRRDGTRLPYGSGSISGIITHERYFRYEWRNGADPIDMEDDPTLAFIGRYEIRPQSKNDIWDNMEDSVEDSFSALLCEYRYWNPDTENGVMKPSYDTNGYLSHTYQEKYTGTSVKDYTNATYAVHMWSAGVYDYLGPIGNSTGTVFGQNYGNKNGCGIVLDTSHETWYENMDDLVSYNPDGTIEWCGPYAANTEYVGYGTGGWTNNNDSANYIGTINATTSNNRGKGQCDANCFMAFANSHWWDYDTNRPYGWLLNFSTAGISTDQLSLQLYVVNSSNFGGPRFWMAQWALTDSQAEEDDYQWTTIGEYTVPDTSLYGNVLFASITAFKQINLALPLDMLGHDNVYIRLVPENDLCSGGVDYAESTIEETGDGTSSIAYIAVRYNK